MDSARRNAAVAQGMDLPGHNSDQFIQYVADNVDPTTQELWTEMGHFMEWASLQQLLLAEE